MSTVDVCLLCQVTCFLQKEIFLNRYIHTYPVPVICKTLFHYLCMLSLSYYSKMFLLPKIFVSNGVAHLKIHTITSLQKMQLYSSLGLCPFFFFTVYGTWMEVDLIVNNYFCCLMQLSSWLISVLGQICGLIFGMSSG